MYYKYSKILLIHEQIKDIYSSQLSIIALLKPANPEIIKQPDRIETFSIFISSIISFIPNPSLLTIYTTKLTSTQQALSLSLKHYEQDLNNYLTPSFYDSTPDLPYSSLLISLFNQLTTQSSPQMLKKITEDLSNLTKPAKTQDPINPTQTTTLEASGQAESLTYEPCLPTTSPKLNFDMSSLKSALKQPNHKILYKQVSTTGSIQISDKPFTSSPPANPIPQIPKFSSFKDFLIFPQKSLITLEGSGENSDNEL